MSKYRIVNSKVREEQFKRLLEQARSERRFVGALLAAQELMAKLQEDPRSLGELLFLLKNVNFPVRHVARGPWSIHAVIDDQNCNIYISKINLLS